MVPVFVYGTLKRGFYNHQVISAFMPDDAVLVGRAETKEAMHLCVGGQYLIPYLQRPPRGEVAALKIVGEVYRVGDKLLEKLDELEGVPHHYTRETTVVELLGTGETLECSIYIKTEPDEEMLAQQPIPEYTLDVHAKYTPPPMRLQEWTDASTSISEKYRVGDAWKLTYPLPEAPLVEALRQAIQTTFTESQAPAAVLEVGCGAFAPFATFLMSETSRVKDAVNICCVDSSPDQVLRANALSLGPLVEITQADLTLLGQRFPARSFDCIVCTHVLDELPSNLYFHVFRTMAALLRTHPHSVLMLDWPVSSSSDMQRYARDLDLKCIVETGQNLGLFARC